MPCRHRPAHPFAQVRAETAFTLIEPFDRLRVPLAKRNRFTLVELLVVIAIIAILAAMLLPSLRRARIAAVRSNCLSNQRQSIMALLSYAGDYQEYPFNAQPGVAPIHDGNAYYEPYGRAPLWGWDPASLGYGGEGAPCHWRDYLIQGGYGQALILGCADSIAAEPSMTASVILYPASWGQLLPTPLETATETRAAPPFVYYGAGVDPARTSVYSTGMDSNARVGRRFRFQDRCPLLADGHLGSGGGARFVTPHSRLDSGPWGAIYYMSRLYDNTIGWSDGAATSLIILNAPVPSGVGVPMGYDWSRQ